MALIAIGKVTDIQGTVEVLHADGTNEILKQGATVYADDAIITSENANARIEFFDGSSMIVGPEFTAVLDQEVYDAGLGTETGTASQVALDASERELAPASGHDTTGAGEQIATVETTFGMVEAIDADGQARVLQAGDILYANDILSVGPEGDVNIRMVDGSLMPLGPGEALRMDDLAPTTVAAPSFTTTDPSATTGSTDPEIVATAIRAGEDPTRVAAAPAAGEAGGAGGDNEGSDIITIETSHRQVTPTSGHETNFSPRDINTTLQEEEILLEPAPLPPAVASVITPSLTPFNPSGTPTGFAGMDNLVREDGLADGSDPDKSRNDTGDLYDTFVVNASDCIERIEIVSAGDDSVDGGPQIFDLATLQLLDPNNSNTHIDIAMGQGTLTLIGYQGDKFSSEIEYRYTLDQNIDNDQNPNSTDGSDVVTQIPTTTHQEGPDYFDDTVLIRVFGERGGNAEDQLTIRALDDNPEASIRDAVQGGITITIDETDGGQSGTNETTNQNVIDLFDSLTGITSNNLPTPQYARDPSGAGVVNTDDSKFGADRIGADKALSLAIEGGAGTDSGLQTADGTTILLYEFGDLVVGRIGSAAGDVAFAVSIDNGGHVSTALYTALKHPVPGDGTTPAGSHNEEVDLAGKINAVVTVTDGDGDSDMAMTDIGDQIRFRDDGPTAVDDIPNAVTEDASPNVISGNVLDNDISGADIDEAFQSWTAPGQDNTAAINALNTYGTLVQNANGTWSYTLDNARPATQALKATDNLSYDLYYTMVDIDGDTSSAKLTIRVNGAADETTVETASADGADNEVYEAGLAAGGSGENADGNPNNNSDPRETDTGTFDIKATDGILNIVIDSAGVGANGGPVTFTLAQAQNFNGSQTVDMGEGTLTLLSYTGDENEGTVAYSYTLNGNIDNDDLTPTGTDDVTLDYFDDTALITVNGQGGSSGEDTLVIRAYDDVPTAVDDIPNAVTEDASPNVISGNVLDNDISGADIDEAFQSWTAPGQDNTAAINALNTYGTLVQNANGTWSYTLDNARPATQALKATDNLSYDLYYTMVDIDGDTSSAKLTIRVNGAADETTVETASADGADNEVYEAGLAAGGSGENADGNPNNNSDPRETDTGTFDIKATDGILNIVIDSAGVGANGGPVTFTLAQAQNFNGSQTVDMGEGTLTLLSYTGDENEGTVAYSYTLNGNIDNDDLTPTGTDDVTLDYFDDTALITVNGQGGSSGEDTLVIRAYDDVPTAVDDIPNAVTEDASPNVISGNVLDNDISGADIDEAFQSWTAPGQDNTAAINALNTYGTLVQNANGTWSYTLDNARPATQALKATDNLSYDLYYTMVDIDGDTSSAKLTIRVNGAADETTVETASADGADNEVYEAGLAAGGSGENADGNPNNNSDPRETDTGTFDIKATDGILNIVIDSAGVGANGGPVTFTLAQAQNFNGSQTVDMGEGTLTLLSYTGDENEGTVAYSYTLNGNIDNDDLTPTGTDDVTLDYFDDTALITVNGQGGSSGEDTLVIRAYDDVPTAVDDIPNAVTEDASPNVISGNVLDNDISGADIDEAFQSWTAPGQDNTAAINALNTYGTLVQNANGTWSYTLDNARPATQALKATDNLSYDLYYTMVDIDGDTSSAKLTIRVNGAADETTVETASADGADNEVYEAGLAAGGSGENADGNPNNNSDPRETDTGTFDIKATDGILNIVIDSAGVGANGGPVTFTLAQAQNFNGSQTVDMGEGTLTLLSYTGDENEGTVAYSYTLNGNIDNDDLTPTGTDDVTLDYFDDTALITVNGQGGSSGEDTLVIRAYDDVPTAVDDIPNAVTEDASPNVISGNVLDNDISGADIDEAFQSWTAPGQDNTAAINALNTYGTLVQNANGTWSYTLDNARPATQALKATDNLSYDLYYTMVDIDGDTSSAKLTIRVNGAADETTVETASADGADNEVYEAGLAAGGSGENADGNPNNNSDPRETDTGTFDIKATDGILNIVIDSAGVGANGGPVTFTLAQAQNFNGSQTVDMGEGTLTLLSYTGDENEGTVAYSYTLNGNIDNDDLTPTGTDDVTLDYFDDTALITVNGQGGSSGEDTLVIRAYDDVPTAVDDTNKVLQTDTIDFIDGFNVLTSPPGEDTSGADVDMQVIGVAQGDTGGPVTGNIGTPITGTLGGTLILLANGDYSYAAPVDQLGPDTFTYTIEDIDGDTSTATLTIDVGGLVVGSNFDDDTTPEPGDDHVFPGNSPDGEILGNSGDDMLVGDPGGIAGKIANYVLVLDSSGSMDDENIDFDGGQITRQEAQQIAINGDVATNTKGLLDKLKESGAENIRIHLIEFDQNANPVGVGTYDIIVDGIVQEDEIAAARAAVNGIDANGVTNYEAGLQKAIDYLEAGDAGPLANADVNQLLFVSDGLPNTVLRGNTTGDVIDFLGDANAQDAINHLTGTYTGPFDPDTVSEIDAIEATTINGNTFTIEAIGIDLDAAADAILDQVEGDGGDADNIKTTEEFVSKLGSLTDLVDVGADIINGGAGNDVIFGDVLNSDQLASAQFGAAGEHDGEGYAALVAHLEDDMGVGNVDAADVINFINDNLVDIAVDGGRGEGDFLDGGAGDDTLIGQGGDDTMTGGDGADTFLWVRGDSGEDTVTDFDAGEGDTLDIRDLLVGEESIGGTVAERAEALDGDYISIATGTNTTVTLFSNGDGTSGENANQEVTLAGYNTAGLSSAEVIESLLEGANPNLVID